MKKLTTLVVLALMLGSLVAGLTIFGGGSAQASHPGTTVFVDDDACPSAGKGTAKHPFCSIQDAVDHASAGDTILVSSGTYNENVVVDKVLVLRGVGATQPVVDAGGESGDTTGADSAIRITANGVTVENFETRNGGTTSGALTDAGIRVESDDNIIIGNTSTANGRGGIFVNGGDRNSIVGNILINNLVCGLVLNDADDNDVSQNDISFNGSSGIRVQAGSDGNSIHHNTTNNNEDGINVRSDNNIIHSNMATNNTVNGIRLKDAAADDNEVFANDVGDNALDGIHIDTLAGSNVIKFNTAINNGDHGIDDDGGNTCTDNLAVANATADFDACS